MLFIEVKRRFLSKEFLEKNFAYFSFNFLSTFIPPFKIMENFKICESCKLCHFLMNQRVYINHRVSNREEFYNEMKSPPLNKERSMMINYMKQCLGSLDKSGIYQYEDFIDSFRKFGFKTNDISNYILEFHAYIKSNNLNVDASAISWIRNRCIKKSNSSEKNLIINLLAHLYPNELLYFTHNYIKNLFPIMASIEIFFTEFGEKIDQLNSSALNVELKNDNLEIENPIKENNSYNDANWYKFSPNTSLINLPVLSSLKN